MEVHPRLSKRSYLRVVPLIDRRSPQSAPQASWLRRCAVWSVPAPALALIVTVVVIAAGCLAWSLATVGLGDGRDLAVFALLAAMGQASNEAIRRVGPRPGGVTVDFHSVWLLPVAVLLPAPYALLGAIIDRAWAQWRVRRSLVHRRVYTAATIGLSHFTAGLVFAALYTGSLSGGAWLHHSTVFFGALVAAASVRRVLNTTLIRSVALLLDPCTTVRSLAMDRDTLIVFGVEMSESICATVLVAVNPFFVIAAVPSVILLHRTLIHSQLTTAARTDPKTGLLNAVTWRQEAERRLERSRQNTDGLAVLLLDVDHFKKVNDTHGHLIGDAVLIQIADLLRDQLRAADLIGRFGGDEFVAVVNASPAQAHEVATRVARQLAAAPLTIEDRRVAVTASLGIATLGTDRQQLDDLLAAADAALYSAKRAGRNRVVSTDISIIDAVAEARN